MLLRGAEGGLPLTTGTGSGCNLPESLALSYSSDLRPATVWSIFLLSLDYGLPKAKQKKPSVDYHSIHFSISVVQYTVINPLASLCFCGSFISHKHDCSCDVVHKSLVKLAFMLSCIFFISIYAAKWPKTAWNEQINKYYMYLPSCLFREMRTLCARVS